MEMDPWLTFQSGVTFPETILTKFEDNFTPAVIDKLPDSEQYLAVLEGKLKKIKNDPNILAQLAAKREVCMQQLVNGDDNVDEEILNLAEPVPNSHILRAFAPEKQALNQGELVDLLGYDQLKSEDSDADVNKNSPESTISP